MNYITEIYFKNINNLSDARFGAGNDFWGIGFNLSPQSENFLGFDKIKEISGWIEGPNLIGTFNHEIKDLIDDAAEICNLDLIEFETFPTKKIEVNTEKIVNLEISNLDENIDLNTLNPDYLILNGHISLLDLNHNSNLLSKIETLKNVADLFLNFNFKTNEVREIVEIIQPFGICLAGGNEIKPGLKNFEYLNEILEELEN